MEQIIHKDGITIITIIHNPIIIQIGIKILIIILLIMDGEIKSHKIIIIQSQYNLYNLMVGN